MIGEGFNRSIQYRIEANYFRFSAQGIDRSQNNLGLNHLGLGGEHFLGRNQSFTVEFLATSPKNQQSKFCYLNSSKKLRDLIWPCVGKAVIREPTHEEMVQVQEYRTKQMGEHLLRKFYRRKISLLFIKDF